MRRYLSKWLTECGIKNIVCIALVLTVVGLGLYGMYKHAESKVYVKTIEELMR